MKLKFLLLNIIAFITFGCAAQTPVLLPKNLPSPKSIGYYELGYIQPDSGILFSSRDTMWHPKKPALVLWVHSGVDTSLWVYDGKRWKLGLGQSGGISSVTWSQGFTTYDARYSLASHTHSFASLTSKPTTLSGYGITDPVALTNATYSNPSFISTLAWSKLTGKPTTLSGYGISDPIVLTSGSYANPTFITSIAWGKLTGTPNTMSGYGILDGLALSTADTRYPQFTGLYSNPTWITALAWSKLTGIPTTLSGYGITDPVVLTSGAYSNPSFISTLAWSKLTGTPNTVSGYNITDAEIVSHKATSLTSPNNTNYPTTQALSNALSRYIPLGTNSSIYTQHPIYSLNDSTIAIYRASHTHSGYLDSTDYDNFNTSFNWGNHATQGYVTANSISVLSNKRVVPRVGVTSSGSTITPNADSHEVYSVTTLATPATIAAPSGTPTDGQIFWLRIKDDGTARGLTWNSIYRPDTLTLPAATVANDWLYFQFMWNGNDTKWDEIAYKRITGAGGGGGGGGGGGTPIYWQMDMQNQYVSTYTNWNLFNPTDVQVQTSGLTYTGLITSTGTSSSLAFQTLSAFDATRGEPIQGSDNGVFPDIVLGFGWSFVNGTQFKLTGLDNTKQYTLYILGDANSWESGVETFTVGSNTSNSTNTSSNLGNHTTYTNFETDPSLMSLTNISPTSGTITVTLNVISGLGAMTALVLKQQ